MNYLTTNISRYLLIILLIFLRFNILFAQISLLGFIETGKHGASEGVYMKNIYRGNYCHDKYQFETGIQLDLVSKNPNVISGLDFITSGKFEYKDFPFDIKGFFMLNRFSDLLYETNWGIRIGTEKAQHFYFELGTNFKTYTINSTAREEFNINKADSKLRENFSLLYEFTACLKPHDNYWNVGLSCTNFDYFIINQSTNPVFNIRTKYRIKPNLTLYMDSWYKHAGIFNIYANFFGYFFRGGIKWEL